MKVHCIALATSLLFALTLTAQEPKQTGEFKIIDQWTVPGGGRWDYVNIDAAARRVYVTHGEQIDVLNADTGTVIGTISDLSGVHGVALAQKLNRGYISNGELDHVVVFDLKTLKKVAEVQTARDPDAIMYEQMTNRVFSFNGKSNNATVIDASNNTVVGTIALGGSPAFAVADGTSHIFVSLEHKNVTLELDAKAMTVVRRIPLAPCETPSGLSMDRGTRRLFVGCDNKLMAVVDADAGKVVTTLPIGEGNDSTVFEPETNLIFASNADGTMNIFHEGEGDTYTAVQTVTTNPKSKTMMVDRKTHHALVPAAEYLSKPEGAERAPVKPGSFRILVIGKEK